jgi:hypothetical protein
MRVVSKLRGADHAEKLADAMAGFSGFGCGIQIG